MLVFVDFRQSVSLNTPNTYSNQISKCHDFSKVYSYMMIYIYIYIYDRAENKISFETDVIQFFDCSIKQLQNLYI